MLVKGSYIPWASRFMRYIDGKNEYGRLIKESILKGPLELKMIRDPGNPNGTSYDRLQTVDDLDDTNKKCFEANIDAKNDILLGIPNEIYNIVDACTNAKAMWIRVRRLMHVTDLSQQELTSRLIDEFDKFKGLPGESIESYYS
ncbi:hypothetical protein Tco_1243045 [Tanacetum coccineum]